MKILIIVIIMLAGACSSSADQRDIKLKIVCLDGIQYYMTEAGAITPRYISENAVALCKN